jgi:hypothetical protein
MDNKNIDRAIEIFSLLIKGESISKEKNTELYEHYNSYSEVFDLVEKLTNGMNLKVYEHDESLHLSPGEKNRVFGFTNDELKKELGIKLNKELYLSYFVIYNIITKFYKDSSNYTFREYINIQETVEEVSTALYQITDKIETVVINEIEEHSFNTLAMLWDDMPLTSTDYNGQTRAGKSSRVSFVKMVFNFLIDQKLFISSEEGYYPTQRFKALVENYFKEARGRLYDILMTRGE